MESRVLFSNDFLNSYEIDEKDILSDLENDVKQLEESYIEPTVIIISSLGFTTVSILYALWTNFYLGLIFILFYSFLYSAVLSDQSVWIHFLKSGQLLTKTT